MIAEKQGRTSHEKIQPYLYHLKGNLVMHHLKFDKAILAFERANVLFRLKYMSPQFVDGFKFSNYNIALCYQKLSKFQEAVKKYTQIVRGASIDVQVLNGLGNSYIEWALQSDSQQKKIQKLKKGIFYLSQAIQTDESYYVAHYNLGYAYLKSKELEKAIQKFQDSLLIKKTSQAQYGLLTSYLLLNQSQKAQHLIQNVINTREQSIDDLLSIMYEYWNSTTSPKLFDKLFAQHEHKIQTAKGHYWKAMIQFSQEKYGLAIAHFLQAYDKGYTEAHLLFNIAYSYELIKEFQTAIQYYEKADKKDPRLETKEKIQQCKSIILNASKTSTQL